MIILKFARKAKPKQMRNTNNNQEINYEEQDYLVLKDDY